VDAALGSQATWVAPLRATDRRKVVLACPHGFCAGVRRAVDTVERALAELGAPVFVRGEIVHIRHVVADLERRGARFVASEADMPEGAVCIFSAHGVAPDVRRNAARRGLRVIDAPWWRRCTWRSGAMPAPGGRSSSSAAAATRRWRARSPRRPSARTWSPTSPTSTRCRSPPDAPVAYAVQTTLAVDDAARLTARLRGRFSDLVGPAKDDICYASQNRQAAVKAIAPDCDVVLVAGARNSSNSDRLVEVARAHGTPAHLVPDAAALDPAWLQDARVVGLGAGARTSATSATAAAASSASPTAKAKKSSSARSA